MKKLTKALIAFCLIAIILGVFSLYYFNNGSVEPENSVWESYIGRHTDVGILPDYYANYYTYTFVRTNKDIGFRIKGKFPDTRYFSFNVYSLGDNATQGSIVDYEIQTDSGKPNPFLVDKQAVDAGKNFTVHLIPSKHKDKNLTNLLPFRDDAKLMTMVIRLYDFNIDDFGGVEFPTVEAFHIGTNSEIKPVKKPKDLNLRFIVRNFSLPKMVERLSLLYHTENKTLVDAPVTDKQYYSLPFHTIDTAGFIENNDNRYLLSAITKQDNEFYIFKFKSPTYTTGPENINKTNMRYWSFNLGNSASYNFNALKDEDALLDENGYVTLVLGDKDPEVELRIKELGYNFMEWNMPSDKALIHFRHMLANPDFESQIDSVPPIKVGMSDFTPVESHNFMGDYAPQGIRMNKKDFLTEYK